MFSVKLKTTLSGVTETVRALNKIDKEITKTLRADLKQAVNPFAMKIASAVPTSAPLSGFNNAGRTRWTGARASVGFTPTTIRRDQTINPLVTIRVTGRGSGAGFDIAEIAGSRGNQFSKNRRVGDPFVQNLNRTSGSRLKAGRYAFPEFLKQRNSIQSTVIKILDGFMKEQTKKLEKAAK